MTPTEISSLLALYGCTMDLVATGDPRYERGFVISDGVTLGRITIKDGEYDHIKWYWRGYGDLVESDYLIFAWSYLLTTSKVLSRDRYDAMVAEATALAASDRLAKIEARLILPRKKRKAVKGRSVRAMLWDLVAADEIAQGMQS